LLNNEKKDFNGFFTVSKLFGSNLIKECNDVEIGDFFKYQGTYKTKNNFGHFLSN
jgi:hypothetical protein